mgnify:FL=1
MPGYEFVSIPVLRTREGQKLGRDHHQVIVERAAAGWELVQILDFSGFVEPHLELIFAKE